jgi:hypothetical protein
LLLQINALSCLRVAKPCSPVEHVAIAGTAHAPHREKLEETLAATAGFINRVLWEHGEAKAA